MYGTVYCAWVTTHGLLGRGESLLMGDGASTLVEKVHDALEVRAGGVGKLDFAGA